MSVARVFELQVAGYDPALTTVVRFSGREGISRLFWFDVDFLAPEGHDVLSAPEHIVGSQATFSFGTTDSGPNQPTVTRRRYIHGLVQEVTVLGTLGNPPRTLARVRVVPPLHLGKLRKTSRVFQNITVPDAAGDVASRTPQPLLQGLTRPYLPRAYCVQYEESDFEFFRRILSEEGVFWYFQYSEDDSSGWVAEPMVLADHPSTYPSQSPIPQVRVSPRGLGQRSSATFELTHATTPNRTRLKDFDFTRPLLDLQSSFALGENAAAVGAAEREWAGLLQVDRYGSDYLSPEVDSARVALDLDQLRRKAWVGRGTSAVDTLLPGYRFTVDSDDTAILDGEYVVTEIEHEGVTPEAGGGVVESIYSNRFQAIPSSRAFRPKRRKRKPRQVMESAVVVGPEAGTVYTDEYGRIRVQFPWDYFGGNNGDSTTWIRVVQGWSGASFGLQFVPRVGMEVMVSFLGGDPDCPVVVGAIPNAANPPPFHLPEQKTRSGIRTESTPGGQGYNEISFEDAAGAEQLFIHAQRDLDEQVNRNHTQSVEKSQLIQIGDDQAISVKGNQDEVVGGRANRTVGADELVEIKAGRVTSIGGSDARTIDGERRVRIGSNDVSDVIGSASWTIGDDLTVRAVGCYTTVVGKQDAERSFTLHVEGTTDLYSREITEIASPKGLRLRCGKSLIEILPDQIDIVSRKVLIRTENTRITQDDDKMELWAKTQIREKSDDELVIASKGAAMVLKDEIKATGSKILLNSPGKADDPDPIPPPEPTKIAVVDQDSKPLAYGLCVLVGSDGSERSVALDKDGKAEVYGLEQSAKIAFPGNTEPGRS